MTTLSRKLSRKNRGQGMTEYIIIVALIAIAAVAVVTIFGQNVRNLFSNSTNVLAGNTSATAKGGKATAGVKGLSDFGDESKQ